MRCPNFNSTNLQSHYLGDTNEIELQCRDCAWQWTIVATGGR